MPAATAATGTGTTRAEETRAQSGLRCGGHLGGREGFFLLQLRNIALSDLSASAPFESGVSFLEDDTAIAFDCPRIGATTARTPALRISTEEGGAAVLGAAPALAERPNAIVAIMKTRMRISLTLV